MTPAHSSSRTIAIPRVLWWFRQWPLWKTFFEGLGCRALTNDPARPTPRHHDHTSTIVEESCYPMQLVIDRTMALAGEADAVFMPRLISIDRRGIMCPRFAGVPDIVEMALGPEQRILSPVVDLREGRQADRRAFAAVAYELGFSATVAKSALREACAVQNRFDQEFEQRLNTLSGGDVFDLNKRPGDARKGDSAFRVALLGHPYIAYDWEFSLDLVGKLRRLGGWVVPVESVDLRRIESAVRKLDKNVYWTSGRDILGAAMSFFQDGGVDGVVYLSCFKCGVDGLLCEIVRWASRQRGGIPYLPLLFDGHDNEVGLTTRLEAFVDIITAKAART